MIISKWFFFSFFSMAYFGVSGASGSPSDKQSRDKLQLENRDASSTIFAWAKTKIYVHTISVDFV